MSHFNVNFDGTQFERTCKDVLTNFTTCSRGINDDFKESEKTKDRQRCKYCGCLISNFDVHCSSCGAPI